LLGDSFETKSEIANSELCLLTFVLLTSQATVLSTMYWPPEIYFIC